MNQKEAVQNILNGLESKHTRYYFLYKWLEDINWHSENNLLWESLSEIEREIITDLEKWEFNKHPQNDELSTGAIIHLGKWMLSMGSLNYEIKKTNYYNALNMIYGWGINNDAFEHSQGPRFVAELMTMVNNVK